MTIHITIHGTKRTTDYGGTVYLPTRTYVLPVTSASWPHEAMFSEARARYRKDLGAFSQFDDGRAPTEARYQEDL